MNNITINKKELKEFLEWLEDVSQECYKTEVHIAILRFLEKWSK